MNWSVMAVGKSDAVAKKLAAEFASIKVAGPEIEVVKAAAVMVDAALAGQVPATLIKVTASGSQSSMGQSDAPTRYTNSVKIDIEPISGFVE